MNELQQQLQLFDKGKLTIKNFIDNIRKISPDKEVFKKAEELMFSHKGRRPKLPDCIIAAICILDNCELYTLNVKDFDYLGVKIFKPL